MDDYIDSYALNLERKLLTFVMCGDWRYRFDIILEVEDIPREEIKEMSISYNGAQTTIILSM